MVALSNNALPSANALGNGNSVTHGPTNGNVCTVSLIVFVDHPDKQLAVGFLLNGCYRQRQKIGFFCHKQLAQPNH